MNKKALVIRDPETSLEVVEGWASIPNDARKRRAAKAVRDDDRDDLRSLLESYTLAFSKSRTDTSPQTLSTYWRGAARLLDWCAANGHKSHSIAGEEISRFIASMGSLSAKSRQTYMVGGKALINALRWCGMGKGNPFQMPNGAPIRIRDPNPIYEKADPYTIAEVKRLLSGANERERCLILLGVDGGLRLAEMCNLKWSGVDQERKLLKFTGKGSKQAKVTATKRLIAALDAMPRTSDRIFQVSRRRLQQIFDRRCEDAKVSGRGVHALRHSCGTRLFELTDNLLIVKRHLRHSSTVISEIYAHLSDTKYLDAVARLESNGYE